MKPTTKKVVENLATVATLTAWSTPFDQEFQRMIERLNTLNQIAICMHWHGISARIQNLISLPFN